MNGDSKQEEATNTKTEEKVEGKAKEKLIEQQARKTEYLLILSTGTVRMQEQLMMDWELNYQSGIFTHVLNLTTKQVYAGNSQWKDIPHIVYKIPEQPKINEEESKSKENEK